MRTLLLSGLLLLCGLPASAQQALAWLSEARGTVEVRRAGAAAWGAAGADLALFAGDRVRTGRLSRAVLVGRGGGRVRLGAEATHTVAAPSGASGRAGRLATVMGMVSGAIANALGRSPAVGTGAARAAGDAAPVLERPRDGLVLSPRPAVHWLASLADSSRYRVQVLRHVTGDACLDGPEGAELVWERAALTDTTLAYPADVPGLLPGAAYVVRVLREADGAPAPDAAADADWGCLTIATDAARETMEAAACEIRALYPPEDPEEITAEIALAAVLIDNGYYADALRVLDEAEARQPGSPTVRRLRGTVYDEAGPPLLIDALR